MSKKYLLFFFWLLVVAALVKALFFSGTARPSRLPVLVKRSANKASVRVSAGEHYQRGWFGMLFLGRHWRNVWATPIEVPVFSFSQTFGGLKPGKLGGGMQTTSLNMTSADGRTFVLRSLDKDPVGVLPAFWRHSVVADLVRDQVSAANPYAALVVASLSESAGVLHTNPQVVFVSAQDKHIRPYQSRLGDRLFLLEEKYSTQFLAPFKSAVGVYSTVKMLDQHYQRQAHLIDQKSFVRCRLFDILLGDWDRHEGQWNWVAYPVGRQVHYKPIPKDRDQAFSRYQDGVLPWLLTRRFAMPKFGHFTGNLTDITPYTINGRFLDERALNALHRDDFLQAAHLLQMSLTNEAIDRAVGQFPPGIYKLAGKDIADQLKQRRQQLKQAALAFYRHLARNVLVTGSDEREKFVVRRLNSRQTLVEVYPILARDSLGEKIYQRFFDRNETASITLQGLGGADEFVLSGKVKSGITIKVVGGPGRDVINDQSVVEQGAKKTLVFDTRAGNQIYWGPETADKTSDDVAVHRFDRQRYRK